MGVEPVPDSCVVLKEALLSNLWEGVGRSGGRDTIPSGMAALRADDQPGVCWWRGSARRRLASSV